MLSRFGRGALRGLQAIKTGSSYQRFESVAVILSGCGVYDGSEITEAVSALISLSGHGLKYQCFAPNNDQMEGDVVSEKRNVLVESARIARGQILPLEKLEVSDFDGLFLPGGFGCAKNLSNYALRGSSMVVLPLLAEKLLQFNSFGKPIGMVCIAPMLAAKLFPHASLTLGYDIQSDEYPFSGSIADATAMGASHCNRSVREVCVDNVNRLVSSPAYMSKTTPFGVFQGVQLVVDEMVRMFRR